MAVDAMVNGSWLTGLFLIVTVKNRITVIFKKMFHIIIWFFIVIFSSQLMIFAEFFRPGGKHMKMVLFVIIFTRFRTIPRRQLKNTTTKLKVAKRQLSTESF